MNMVRVIMLTFIPFKAIEIALRAYKRRSINHLLMIMLILCNLPMIIAVGTETPKVNFQDYFLPGVTRWDGIPYHDFRRVWWIALCAALGNISQEGWSLLQTARDQDLGSPGNPGTPNRTKLFSPKIVTNDFSVRY